MVRPTLPMSTPPSSPASTNQVSKVLRTLTIDFTGVNQHLPQEIISNLLTHVFPTLTLSQIQDFSYTQSMCLQIYAQGVI